MLVKKPFNLDKFLSGVKTYNSDGEEVLRLAFNKDYICGATFIGKFANREVLGNIKHLHMLEECGCPDSYEKQSFNLERALAGDKVISLEGRKVLDLHHFSKMYSDSNLVVLFEGSEYISFYSSNGKQYRLGNTCSQEDLWMHVKVPCKCGEKTNEKV